MFVICYDLTKSSYETCIYSHGNMAKVIQIIGLDSNQKISCTEDREGSDDTEGSCEAGWWDSLGEALGRCGTAAWLLMRFPKHMALSRKTICKSINCSEDNSMIKKEFLITNNRGKWWYFILFQRNGKQENHIRAIEQKLDGGLEMTAGESQ